MLEVLVAHMEFKQAAVEEQERLVELLVLQVEMCTVDQVV
jgi:hypothetical protein